MNILLIFCFLFFVGATIGWIIEVLFRKFLASDNPEHEWANPGFLVGPYLPLYGTGLCVLYSLTFLENIIPFENKFLCKICLFMLMMICMTLLEYISGMIFVVKMKVKLWDYSNRKGNIKGIICPLFSFLWMVISAAYYFLVHPKILNALSWLSENLAFSFFIGMFFGVFFLDVCYSLKILVKIKAFAEEYEIIVRYEELKVHFAEIREKNKEKKRFLFSFRSKKEFKNVFADFAKKKKKK